MDPMIAALLRPEAYGHPVEALELLETHASWVILTGPYAYKLKKPVNFGFLDFSSSEQRLHCCREELRLNRRLSPELYLGLEPVHGPAERASFQGDGPVIEHAVRMRQFPQSDLLPAALARGAVGAAAFDAFAEDLARFQASAAVAQPGSSFGTPEAVRAPVDANLRALAAVPTAQPALAQLAPWVEAEFERLTPLLAQRLRQGWIREGHGDLHLGNLLLDGGRIAAFDCLEFSPQLRWIDTISELAFLAMDLAERGRPDLAHRLRDRLLELTGDRQGLELWRWYTVYRATVRAKVAALRGDQPGLDASERMAQRSDLKAYLELALASTRTGPVALVLTHGPSGSGKSWLSQELVERLGAIRLRSDVERKRPFGLWGIPAVRERQGDPYAPAVSEELFAQWLPALARQLLTAGCLTVVDATFGLRRARRPLEELAHELGVPLLILELQTPPELARSRIQARRRRGLDPSDADLAVLEQQLRNWEPLEGDERGWTLRVPTTAAGESDGAATAALLLETLSAAEPAAPLAPAQGRPLDF
ncbi:AAA family ATPase [Vulcanococcus limneticus Candia 3F8]|uniref:bifunctional aminoglycoside phosphotransferase/ATP-binding protein n=1 Tax=Vulcanococcus limneticus TaxID=2170428 RepID=UPI000B993175|nr:bifunctional aminoglycoside phosphotransferase/ATP-binding protein [Vulcanococcus limneticus]MCP9790964.1 AAA family ATPase [Vulcanococcus limneticus MW73D5]MCP9892188.1 AAA family ATPase [Vulcanococcus limneticus Candia 3F8]MCP9895990.1 AAA family ATPase [Vulcanococcus limneticus Candia 3B3]